ncbi:MAG: hypothetical protein LUG84_05525 [Akkermansiaceae bacterium]|nr:hypothetical protein [Akkermansiaceae bacterium]MCD8071518.1 hypothetical protein [Akkermansiaceae bacterium]
MPEGISSELYGKYDHKLDPKNRVAIPSEWRHSEECPLILLEATKQNFPVIKAFSPEYFRSWVKSIRRKAAAMSDVSMAAIDSFIGHMYAECVSATISAQGKLLIPKKMCARLGLSGEARLVGRGPYFEVWSPEAFIAAEERELAALKCLNDEFGVF